MSESIDRRFDRMASRYAEFRPTCPPSLIDSIAAACERHDLAWEPGCGSGQATIHLANRFDRVLATDPAESAIASAEPTMHVRYEVGTAESCSLAAGSVNCIAVGQAAHWFDMDAFAEEAKRVAADACVVALWCYDRPRTSPAIDDVVDHLYFEVLAGCWAAGRSYIDAHYADLPFPFVERPLSVPDYEARWTVEQMIGYLRTWSAVDAFAERGGGNGVDLVETELRSLWGDEVHSVRFPAYMRFGSVR